MMYHSLDKLETRYIHAWKKISLYFSIATKCEFLLSLTHVMVEKVLFWGQIFKMEILMDLNVMRFPEPENHIFSFWFVWLCVCYPHSSEKKKLQQKHQIWYSTIASCTDATWNFSWRSDKNSVYRGTQKNSNTLRPKNGISW